MAGEVELSKTNLVVEPRGLCGAQFQPLTSQYGHPFNSIGLLHPAWREFAGRSQPANEIPAINEEMLLGLEELFEYFSLRPIFPKNQCISTSQEVATKFNWDENVAIFCLISQLDYLSH